MDIVACTDKWFVMPTGVMMYSVCVNNPDLDIVFHIIHDESITEKDKHDLEQTVTAFHGKQIVFYMVNVEMFAAFPNLQNRHDITQASYYRLMLSEILPESIEKVLYLDGDIIVRGSILPLWETDIADYAVAAVRDPNERNIEFYTRLRYPSDKGYFNAGVLLVNLHYWRDHNLAAEFNEFLRTRASDIVYHDQDVLNAKFYGSKVNLPLKYNFTSGLLYSDPRYHYWRSDHEWTEALQDCVVLHFYNEKPWSIYQRNRHPFSNTWYKYQDQTIWKGLKFDKRSRKMKIINFVADTLRKWKLKSQITDYCFIDIAPID